MILSFRHDTALKITYDISFNTFTQNHFYHIFSPELGASRTLYVRRQPYRRDYTIMDSIRRESSFLPHFLPHRF